MTALMNTLNKTFVLSLVSLALGSSPLSKLVLAQQAVGVLRADEVDLPILQNSQMSIDVTSKKKEFVKGEPVQVDITLKNEGANKTKVTIDDVEQFFDIDVIGPDSLPAEKFPPIRYGGSRAMRELNRNPALTGTVTLSQLFIMSRPGEYKVTVSKKFRFENANKPALTVKSELLTLHVTPEPRRSQWHSIVGPPVIITPAK